MMDSKDINILSEAYMSVTEAVEAYDSDEIAQSVQGLAPVIDDLGKFPAEELANALKFMLDSGNSIMVDTHTGSANIEEYGGEGENIIFHAATEDGESVDVSPDDIVRIVGMEKMDSSVSGTPDEPENNDSERGKRREEENASMQDIVAKGHATSQKMSPGKGQETSPNFGMG